MRPETADFVPGAAVCRNGRNIHVVFYFIPFAPFCENVTSSTKPEGHNLLNCRQRRTKRRPQVSRRLPSTVDFGRPTLPALLYIGVCNTDASISDAESQLLLVVRKLACRPEPDVLTRSYKYTLHVYYTSIYTSICPPSHHFIPYTTFHRSPSNFRWPVGWFSLLAVRLSAWLSSE